MKRLVFFLFAIISLLAGRAQQQQYKVAVIGFYNLENLFDTINNPNINDDDFTPKGNLNYTSKIYWDKQNKLSTVISQMGANISPDGPAILGVAEIENDTVLNDLVNMPKIKDRNYKIVHYDSPDERGIDVALLYNPRYFKVDTSHNLFVQLPGGSKEAFFTRDVLWVQGKLDGETIHVYVNHWPSRRGGEERSAPARNAAAAVVKRHMDSILKHQPNAKVVIMGDLNDDPISPSLVEVLRARGKVAEVKPGGLFNPWMDLYKKGIGTLAYQDAWGLFDQILVSHAWLDKKQDGFFFYQQHIFNKEYMVENQGRYKGYPMRTWDGSSYRGGYSDHFPTFLVMLKRLP
ncbi:MAG TPA: endonuclease/exonuclease/phosphatase [Lacibacter sp.]|nr:endonuclease/exonuclease/phosphatase [Lacibacter sp.]HMO89466.1 endonuclease/exonuclease/phosphatase [Lacibacter sp.]